MAFENLPVVSQASTEAKPRVRTLSRHCVACEHRARLLAASRGPVSLITDPPPEPELPEEPEPRAEPEPSIVIVEMVKSESDVTEALEDRDPNKLNQHLQVLF